jgi:hypothetical protein
LDRGLVTKPSSRGRAIWQAVTRVKLEQASKVKSWMPTRPNNGEGRAEQGRNRRRAPVVDGVVIVSHAGHDSALPFFLARQNRGLTTMNEVWVQAACPATHVGPGRVS